MKHDGGRIAAEKALDLILKVENTRAMKSLSKAILALAAASLIGLAYAAEQPEAVIHFPHEKVDATFAKGGSLLQTNNYKIMAGRRSGPGAVEIHEKDTDIFYILDGTATFITGGKANEVKEKSPGEFVAKEIVGGDDAAPGERRRDRDPQRRSALVHRNQHALPLLRGEGEQVTSGHWPGETGSMMPLRSSCSRAVFRPSSTRTPWMDEMSSALLHCQTMAPVLSNSKS